MRNIKFLPKLDEKYFYMCPFHCFQFFATVDLNQTFATLTIKCSRSARNVTQVDWILVKCTRFQQCFIIRNYQPLSISYFDQFARLDHLMVVKGPIEKCTWPLTGPLTWRIYLQRAGICLTVLNEVPVVKDEFYRPSVGENITTL